MDTNNHTRTDHAHQDPQDRPIGTADELAALADTLERAISGGVPPGDDAPETVARMILDRAVTVRDFLRADLKREVYSDDPPVRAIHGSHPEQFDRHYQLLRGIISTSRALFQEVNEPSGEGGLNPAASEISCALDCLISQLDTAMATEPASGPAFNNRQ